MSLLNLHQSYLVESLRYRDSIIKKPPFMRLSRYQFVLEYGCWYAAAPPMSVPIGDEQQCFKNALELVANDPSLTYVEGFALYEPESSPIHHAWVTSVAGDALDPTWTEPGVAYYGVPFKTTFVLEAALAAGGIRSILDDWADNWPILRELSQRPDEWLERRGISLSRVDVIPNRALV